MDKKRNFVNLNINPCKQCMPLGAALVFRGIEESMMLLHGSQGCSTYIRRHMAAHYNEPVDIASSSLSEHGTVYGGADNMKRALKNIIKLYNPKIIGVATTCLAETIGEDILRIKEEFLNEEADFLEVVNLERIISVPTPGYGGTQQDGYYSAVKKVVEEMARGGEKGKHLNIIAPNISPRDIREIKKIVNENNIEAVIFPDVSETLDSPYKKEYKKIPEGGTKTSEIEKMGTAYATIEFGITYPEEKSAGVYLEEKFGIKNYRLPIPIGLENTDLLIKTLHEIYGIDKEKYYVERGRMIDGMIDSHKHNSEGRAAIFGESETVYAVTKACLENGIFPAVIATGGVCEQLKSLIEKHTWQLEEKPQIIDDTDFQTIRERSEKMRVNIMIGNSGGKFIAEKDGIPLVRIGFPVHDRVGAQRTLNIGYEGSMRFIDSITNTLLEEKYTAYRGKMYDTFYKELEETEE